MKIVECQQMSPEWFESRRGIPTASRFDQIITPVTGKPSTSAAKYICELIAEMYWPGPLHEREGPRLSRPMLAGIEREPEARRWYEVDCDVDCRQVGFCITDCGRWGCSPDALVGEDGALELKCPQLETHTGYLLAGTLPSEYAPQVHGHLLVTGRSWCDFVSYCPPLPSLRVRVEPNGYTDSLKKCLEEFTQRYAEALAHIRSLQ